LLGAIIASRQTFPQHEVDGPKIGTSDYCVNLMDGPNSYLARYTFSVQTLIMKN